MNKKERKIPMVGKEDLKIVHKEEILPCDLNRPFAFISYSSQDKHRVWEDVYYLQEKGYNLWIDTNLKATDDTWQKAALEAISNINCEIVIFYLSKSSVISEPCLKELCQRKMPDTLATHNGKEVPLLIVDVEEIKNVIDFRNNVHKEIKENKTYSVTEKGKKASTLTTLMDEHIPNNDKLRVLSNQNHREGVYYQEILKHLDSVAKNTVEENYNFLIYLLSKRSNYEIVAHWLEKIDIVPAIILLVFLYQTEMCTGKDIDKVNSLLMWIDMIPDEVCNTENLSWIEKGCLCMEENNMERAVAYFLMDSMENKTPEGYYQAGRVWMKLDNYEFTKKCLQLAKELGHVGAGNLYKTICGFSEEKFHSVVKAAK